MDDAPWRNDAREISGPSEMQRVHSSESTCWENNRFKAFPNVMELALINRGTHGK